MIRNLTLRAALGAALIAAACAAAAGAAAQQYDQRRGRDDPRGPPARAYERFDTPRGREGPMRRDPGPGNAGPAPPSYAPPGYPSAPYRRLPDGPGARPGRIAPLASLIEGLQRRSPGRELDADLSTLDGRPVYRILWVTAHGRRMDLVLDAETGAVLSER